MTPPDRGVPMGVAWLLTLGATGVPKGTDEATV